ncbi:hypothetical protein MHU86_22042 [Fragilaria crotonensis]|nr:hypothetical protein MHU86_22042 [Fragilaria crotonensis]
MWANKLSRAREGRNVLRNVILTCILSFSVLTVSMAPRSVVHVYQEENKSSTDFTRFLVELARLPTKDLQKKLYYDDVFELAALETAQRNSLVKSCPLKSLPPWLPPSALSPRVYHRPSHVIWYEHLSKAGGTSFCKLAQTNLNNATEVPAHYCMPGDGRLKDGRVGLWNNSKLLKYREKKPLIRIVSNEWNPFPPDRWKLEDQLYFVTTIRDPLDRLVSAYQFWGIMLNKKPKKPTFDEWLVKNRETSFNMSALNPALYLHIARYNFIAWKFSNGTMPQGDRNATDSMGLPVGVTRDEEDQWLAPFVMAAKTLSKFDLVLVLELMPSYSSKMLVETLGWNNLSEIHVVSAGKVHGSSASRALAKDVYDALWDDNRFDMILYLWMKAVQMIRSQCK